MKKLFLPLILFTAGYLSCSGPGVNLSIIRIKGSDSMLRLNELLAEEFMESNPGVSIYVEGGGTASGIKALSEGIVDISAASRTVKAEEVKDISERFGSLGLSFIIAKDAVSIFVNRENPIDNFTQAQLKSIFSGEITNWKELGWENKKITLVVRNPNSGTQLYFKEHILGESIYPSGAIIKSTTEEVAAEVSDDKYAISFGSYGYHGTVKLTKVEGVEITDENIRKDEYPISRYLMFYTLRTPKGSVKDFIDWCMSPKGQEIVNKAGYIPLWSIPY